MAKFAEADARKFNGIFVCKTCKTKQRAPVLKVLAHRINCRKCNCNKMRVKKKK